MDAFHPSFDSSREADFLRRALAAAGVCAWQFDLASGEMTWSDALFRLHDADPRGETPTLERAVGFFAAEARAPFAQAIRRAVESGEPWDLELPLVSSSGRRVWVRTRGSAEQAPDGHCTRLTGTYEDVTAARRARDAVALQRGEQGMLALVAENTSDAVIVTDARDLIQWVNGSFTRLTGYGPAEVAGRKPRDILNHPDTEHGAGFRAAQAARARHEPVIGADLKLQRKDGSAYWAMVEVREVRNPAGEITHHIHIHRDITERYAADERNRALLERLQLTATFTGFGYAERDVDSGIAIWDAQTFRLHGLAPPGEGLAVGPSREELDELIEPEDRAALRASFQRVLGGAGSIDLEYRVRDRQTGRLRHLHVRGGVAPGRTGGARRTLSVVMDVTAARMAEKQRAAQEQRLALALSAGSLGAWEVDLDAGTAEWNAPMRRMFGLPDGTTPPLVAELVDQCVHPAHRERAARKLLDFLRGGGSYEDELRVVQPGGAERWVLLRATRHRSQENQAGRVIGVALDVTEQRAAGERLKEALERLELATNNAGVGTYMRDMATGAGHWDAQTWALFGLDPQPGAPDYPTILAAIHPDDRARYQDVIRSVGSPGAPREIEVRVVHRDGTSRWLLIRGRSPVGDRNRRAGVVIDITARKQAEQRATEYSELLRLSSSTVGIGLWQRDLVTKTGQWDAQMRAILEVPPDAPVPDFDAICAMAYAEDRPRLRDFLAAPPAPGEIAELSFRFQRANGEIRHLLVRRVAHHEADGDGNLRPLRVYGAMLDVTESRRSADALRESQSRFELTSNVAEIGFFERPLDKRPGYWSAQMWRLYGEEPRPYAPSWDWMLEKILPEDHAPFEAQWERLKTSPTYIDSEFRVRRADGTVAWLQSRARLETGGDRPRVVGVTFDVTARKHAELEAREFAHRLHLVTTTVGIGLWHLDVDGRNAEPEWDVQMRRIFGLADDAPVPPFDDYLEMVVPEDRPRVVKLRGTRPTPGEVAEIEYRIRRPDGRVRNLLSRRVMAVAPDGLTRRMLGAALDVTDLRQSANRLDDAQQRLQNATLLASDIGTWERDLETGEARLDPVLFRLYGLEPGERALSRPELLKLVHPDDRATIQRFWRDMETSDRAMTCEFRVRRRDGQVVHLYSRGRAEFRADGRPWRVVGATLDVTASVQAQQRLRELGERLALASSATGIGFWEYSAAADRITCDTQTKLTFGFEPDAEGLTINDFIERVLPEDRAIVVEAWARTPDRDETVEYEFRIRHPQAGVRTVFCRRTTRVDEHGQPARHICVSIDVTASREATRERDLLRERLELVADVLGIGVWDWDPVAHATFWNGRMYELFGRPRDWFAERTWCDAVHPDDRDRAQATLVGALRSGDRFAGEFRVVRADGSVRWLESRGHVTRDADGRATRMLGAAWDVTDRHAAEEGTRDAERRARELLERIRFSTEVAGIGLWEYDVGTLESHMDDVVYALYGLTREQMPDLARRWVSRVHPEDRERVRQEAARMRDSDTDYESEFRVIHPNGAVRHLMGRARRIVDANGRARVLGVNWDITERRVAAGALQAKEVAERANRAKTEFLSRMSHELRTPLNAIIGFTQVLELDRTQPLTPLQHDRVEKIRQGGWHLLTLINEILDLSRIEAGEMKLTMAMVPLATVVDECVALVSADAARRGIHIAHLQAPTAPEQVWADRTRVKQVLLNLLSNAVKYNRDGGRIDVRLAADDLGRGVIVVRDTGHGMTPAQLANLFQPFNRLGREYGAVEGTGIGLAISLKLAQQMGGEITATSEPGGGSEFRFVLQAASTTHDESTDVLQGIVPTAAAAASETRGTVLYVEDNASNVAVVEQLLALRPKVKLFTAPDGASGRVLAAVCQPDLILLDMRLPDTDGLALLRELRTHPETAAIPCVGLSANALPGDVAHARANGFLDYWTKPIEAGPFLRGIDTLLARKVGQ